MPVQKRGPRPARRARASVRPGRAYPPVVKRPALPPLQPGRSALLAFLDVERGLREETAREEARAAQVLEAAEAEATRLKEACEQGLKQRVLDAERQSLRAVEARTRDRVSEARAGVQRWIDEAEGRAADAVVEALELLTRDPEASEGASGETP